MLSLQVQVKVQAKEPKLTTWTFVVQVPHVKVMVARIQFKHLVAPLLFARIVALHLLVLYMVGCLCHDSNP